MKKINVLVDYGFFRWQKFGGISRYHVELIKRMKKNEKVNIDVGVILHRNYYLQEIKGQINFLSENKYIDKVINFINKIYNIFLLKKKYYKIFHPTSNGKYYIPFLKKTKLVVTIHDMIDEKIDKIFSKEIIENLEIFICQGKIWNYKKNIEARKLNIYRADKIIAISQNTKNDILEIYPDISTDKIVVIYHGISKREEKLNKRLKFLKENKIDKYILFVGERKFLHKNFNNFILGVAKILKEENIYLICSGGGKFTNEEIEKFKMLEVEKRIYQFDSNDSELTSLYLNANLFVSPSLYEGFGLPLLEAMKCNCLMAISNTSCYPEIAQDAAFYFDPYKSISIYECVKKALNSPKLASKKLEISKEIIKKFDWKITTKKTLDVYFDLIKNNDKLEKN